MVSVRYSVGCCGSRRTPPPAHYPPPPISISRGEAMAGDDDAQSLKEQVVQELQEASHLSISRCGGVGQGLQGSVAFLDPTTIDEVCSPTPSLCLTRIELLASFPSQAPAAASSRDPFCLGGYLALLCSVLLESLPVVALDFSAAVGYVFFLFSFVFSLVP